MKRDDLEQRRRGRPRRIKTPAEFEVLANAYFDKCDKLKEPYLMTGLALGMGLCSRVELFDYAGYEEFEFVARQAIARVEMGYEKRLQEGKPVGAIFALKNMGWRDERHVDNTSSDGSMSAAGAVNVALDTSKLTTDQLAALWGAMAVTVKGVNNAPDVS